MAYLPRAGDRIAERYRLEEPLSLGVLGAVWRAVDETNGRVCALKFLSAEGSGLEAVLHLRRAALVYELIEHEGAVPILDVVGVGEGEDAIPVAITPFVPGVDLDRWLRDAPRTLEEARAVIREALDVLAAAHGHRDAVGRPDPIVHLGLKPSEIRVGEATYAAPSDGRPMRVRVADFGLARDVVEEDAHGTSVIVGTPRYASPEMLLRPSMAGPSADVWSIGVMLYTVASGVPPFGVVDDTPFLLQRRIVDEAHASLATRVPGLPPAFVAIVDRCLAKDPRERFADAGALAAALDALPPFDPSLAASPIPSFPSSSSRRFTASVPPRPAPTPVVPGPSSHDPDARRRRRGALVGAVLGLAIGAVGVTYLVSPGRLGVHRGAPRTRVPAAVAALPRAARDAAVAATVSVDAGRAPSVPSSDRVAALVADNPFRTFRTAGTPRRLGCEREPPSVAITVNEYVDVAPVRPAAIDGGLLRGLVPRGVCGPGETRDARGLCWVVGCPEGTIGPDESGRCAASRSVVAPIQSCFRPTAHVESMPPGARVALQEHEVTFAELGRFLRETSQRAWLAVEPSSLDAHGASWDGTVVEGMAQLPAHGVPRTLAAAYCAAIEARLPTEVELESAARGRHVAPSPWGAAFASYGVQVAALLPSGSHPRPVRDPASLDRTVADDPIHELVSNVREWASDAYVPDAGQEATPDPLDAGVSERARSAIALGVVRGLPLVLPSGWPRVSRPRDVQAWLPVPAAHRTALCVADGVSIATPGPCATQAPGYVASLRDVGFRCARDLPAE